MPIKKIHFKKPLHQIFGEKYYRKESFIVVINTGLDTDLSITLSFKEIRKQLRYLYNAA